MDKCGVQCQQLNKDSLCNSTSLRKNDIAANLREHRKEICDAITSIDSELVGLLVQKGIVANESELVSIETQQKRVDFVLERVETRRGDAFNDLLWCLDQTGKSDIGHRYAAALLRRECSLVMLSEILTSMKLQQRYQEPEVMEMTRSLQVKHLVPYLMKNKLVAENEAEQFTQMTQKKGVLKLLRIIKQKGPLAHLYLTKALIDGMGENKALHEDILTKIQLLPKRN